MKKTKNIGQKIKDIREARGLSQHGLSLKIDYTRGTISGWERGRSKPSEIAKKQLTEALGVEL